MVLFLIKNTALRNLFNQLFQSLLARTHPVLKNYNNFRACFVTSFQTNYLPYY